MRLNSWLADVFRRLNSGSRPHSGRRFRQTNQAASAITEYLEPRRLLSAAPAGFETQVNTYTTGFQSGSNVAEDSSGDYVVVWNSAQGQNFPLYGIYAQRYDKSGVAQGTEFQVNTYSGGDLSEPTVAMDSKGDFVVAWTSDGQDGNLSGIYAQRYNSLGVAQGGEFKVNSFTTGSQSTPAIAMDSTGDFVVTWMSYNQDGDGAGIFAQRYNSIGIAQGGEFQVNSFTTGSQSTPSIAMDSAGDFVIAWKSFGQDGSDDGIYARRYSAAGVAQAVEFQVNSFTTGTQDAAKVAMDSNGDFVVAWESLYRYGNFAAVFFQRYDSTGVAQGGEVRVNTSTNQTYLRPNVAMDAKGNFVVTSNTTSSLGGSAGVIDARQYNADGTPVGADFHVNTVETGEKRNSSIAIDSSGNFVVVWESRGQDGDQFGVFSQRFIAAPKTSVAAIGLETRVNSPRPGNTFGSKTAADQNGNSVVVWTTSPDGTNYDIYAQRYAKQYGAFVAQGGEFRVNTNTGGKHVQPAVAMDATGDFVVTWVSDRQDGSNYGIYAQRFNAAGVAQGGEFLVNSYTSGYQLSPAVAMDAIGDFVITWAGGDNQDGSGFGIYAETYNSAGVALSSEFRANSYTTGDQTAPSVAMDANGEFVIAWQSDGQDGEFTGIFARRFHFGGTFDGGEFLVNTFTTNFQNDPAVAMDAAGDFVVTWSSYFQTNDRWDIFGQRYNSSGNRVGTEFQVNTDIAADERFSSVAIDTNGDFVVAWNSGFAGGYDIHAQRFSAAGTKRGNEFKVNTQRGGAGSSVGINASGDFLVTWSGGSNGIYLQRYMPTVGPIVTDVLQGVTDVVAGTRSRVVQEGDKLTSLVTTLSVNFSDDMNAVPGGTNSVTNPANWQLTRYGIDVSSLISGITFGFNSDSNRYVAVVTFSQALTEGGYQLIAWQAIQDLAGQPLDGDVNGISGGDFRRNFAVAQTVLAGPETKVNTNTPGSQSQPSIATDAAGNYIVTWQSDSQDGSGYGIYAQRFNAAGIALGSEFLVNSFTTGNQTNSVVAVDASGNFVIAWSGAGQQDDSGIYAKKYNSTGTALGNEIVINTYKTGTQIRPSIAMDSKGDFVISWDSVGEDGSGYGVFAQRYGADGFARGIEFQINTYTTNNQFSSSVAMDAIGDFTVCWESVNQDGVSAGIYRKSFFANGIANGLEFEVYSSRTQDNNQLSPVIAMNGAGDFVIAWENAVSTISGTTRSVYTAAFTESGNPFGRNLVATGTNLQNYSVAMNKSGEFVVTWDRNDPMSASSEVFARRYDFPSIAQGNEFQVNTFTTNAQSNPAVAIDANGDFVIAWQSLEQDQSGYGIYSQRYRADVSPFVSQIEPLPINVVASLNTPISWSLQASDLDDTNLSSAIIQFTNNFQFDQDQLTFTNTSSIKGAWNSSSGMLVLSGTDTVANYNAAIRSVSYHNSSSSPNTSLTRTIQIQVSDGVLPSNAVSRDVNVLATTSPPSLSPVSETATYVQNGTPVTIAPNLVVTVPNSVDIASATISFTNWQADDRIGFANLYGIFNGLNPTFTQNLTTHTAVFGFVGMAPPAVYQAALQAVSYFNISNTPITSNRNAIITVNNGLANSASVTNVIAVIAEKDLNHPPVGTPKTVTTLEDKPYVFTIADFGFTDPNDSPANSLFAVKVVLPPAVGSLTNNGVAVTPNASVLAADIALGKLKFMSVANKSGTAYTTFTFKVQDNGGVLYGGVDTDLTARVMTISVTPVNDPPAGASKTVTTVEDKPYVFTIADFGLTDSNDSPANSLLAVKVLSVPAVGSLTNNGVAVTTNSSVLASDIAVGNLKFTPVANKSGAVYAAFAFTVQDNGGVSNGGIDTDLTARLMTISVLPVNDPPVGASKTVTTLEDKPYVFTIADFGLTDSNDSPANSLLAVKVVSPPAVGSLTNNGVAVTPNASVLAVDIAAGNLKFTPAANKSGAAYATFTFEVQDNGGVLNGGVDTDLTARVMTISVLSVNDPPVGASKTVTTLEDKPYVFTIADFGLTDSSDSPANSLLAVKVFSVPAVGSLTNNGVTVTTNSSVLAADIALGKLKFTPVANKSGAVYAAFAFRVQDNGGVLNGGVDADLTARVMTIAVTPVNDPPAGASKTVTTLEDKPYVFTIADFGLTDSNDSPANSLLAVKVFSVPAVGSLTNNGVTVTTNSSVLAADIALGKLKFTPVANKSGAVYAAFAFRVQDNGGVLNGGVDTDLTARVMTIAVTPVNDAPAGTAATVTMAKNTTFTFGVTNFGLVDSNDVPANVLLSVKITGISSLGTLANNGVKVVTGQIISAADIIAGKLKYTPPANSSGTAFASFFFQVQDNGGTLNGGLDIDLIPKKITINVV